MNIVASLVTILVAYMNEKMWGLFVYLSAEQKHLVTCSFK